MTDLDAVEDYAARLQTGSPRAGDLVNVPTALLDASWVSSVVLGADTVLVGTVQCMRMLCCTWHFRAPSMWCVATQVGCGRRYRACRGWGGRSRMREIRRVHGVTVLPSSLSAPEPPPALRMRSGRVSDACLIRRAPSLPPMGSRRLARYNSLVWHSWFSLENLDLSSNSHSRSSMLLVYVYPCIFACSRV